MSSVSVESAAGVRFDADCEIAVIGAGAAGLTAALRARAAGADVVMLERDRSPTGSTSLSSGFAPAAGSRWQKAAGVDDDPQRLVGDIQAKAGGRSRPDLAMLAAVNAAPSLEWLADAHGLEWVLLDDFLYPGHSRHRMHAMPEKTGAALQARLLAAASDAGAALVGEARVETLYTDGDRVMGLSFRRPDGQVEQLGCRAVILACNGYGGNPDLVREHLPDLAGAPYFGHAGNTGDALKWGEALGAQTAALGACQGHGSVAHPHGVLISWALMMQGGVQVNSLGRRFSNEHKGYSEQSVEVLRQPGGVAWNLFDARLLDFARTFPDFREAEAAGALIHGADSGELAAAAGLPADGVAETLDQIARYRQGEADPFGRSFQGDTPLAPPYCAVKVTGALFHTQGGLLIDENAAVLRGGAPVPGLYACGGAACGVSGEDISGYLSGNGLLTALSFGWIAGRAAAG